MSGSDSEGKEREGKEGGRQPPRTEQRSRKLPTGWRLTDCLPEIQQFYSFEKVIMETYREFTV